MRSSRWHAPLLFAVLAAFAAAATARAVPVVPITTLIAEQQVATWRCADQRGIPRPRPSVEPWALPKSTAYRRWVLATWIRRHHDCVVALHAHDPMIRTLNRGLAGTPMAGTGRELERAGRRHHIHPAFIAAIAGTESSFGAAACHDNHGNRTYNAFGLASCGSGWHVPYFSSWEQAYEFMSRYLAGLWPRARTTYDYVHPGYAACTDCWGRKTATYMRDRFGLGNTVHY